MRRHLIVICLLALVLSLVPSTQLNAQSKHDPTPLSVALLLSKKLEEDQLTRMSFAAPLASSFGRHQSFDLAFEFVKRLEADSRIESYFILARLALESKNTTAVDKALAAALELAPELDEDGYSDFLFATELVRLAIENKNLDLALSLVAKTPSGSKKAAVFHLLASHFLSLGDKDKSASFLENALAETNNFWESESFELVDELASIASDFQRLGKTERALEVAKRARLAVTVDEQTQQKKLESIALMDARMGNYQQALNLIAAMSDDEKFSATLAVANVHFSSGDKPAAMTLLSEARELANNEKVPSYRRNNLSKLVNAYLSADSGDIAVALLSDILDHDYSSSEAIEIASWFQRQKRFNEATSVLRTATRKVASAESEKSEDIPGYASYSMAKQKSTSLLELVKKYVELGDAEDAELAAKSIDQPQFRVVALAFAASAFAKQGDRKKARSILASTLSLSDKSAEYRHDLQSKDALLQIVIESSKIGLNALASEAVSQFLKKLEIDEADDYDLNYLFEIGLVVDSNKIHVDESSSKQLNEILRKVEENN